jgi:hypothetical protein
MHIFSSPLAEISDFGEFHQLFGWFIFDRGAACPRIGVGSALAYPLRRPRFFSLLHMSDDLPVTGPFRNGVFLLQQATLADRANQHATAKQCYVSAAEMFFEGLQDVSDARVKALYHGKAKDCCVRVCSNPTCYISPHIADQEQRALL